MHFFRSPVAEKYYNVEYIWHKHKLDTPKRQFQFYYGKKYFTQTKTSTIW